MIDGKKVLAVVPARAGSKGLVGKNLRLLGNLPLVLYPIQSALNSHYIDHVYCSTDSEEIAKLAGQAGADINYRRPVNLALDTTPSVDVILDAIRFFECSGMNFDFLVMLEPTSPMTESTDIDAALEMLNETRGQFKSLVAVSVSISGHPQFTFRMKEGGFLTPFVESQWKFKRRQELERLYFQTGSLYVSEVQSLKRTRSFITDATIGYEVPKLKSFEIDDEIDFKIVEMLMLDRDN